jgi:hypothetical protein
MAYTTADLIPDSLLISVLDRIASMYNRMYLPVGNGTEVFSGVLLTTINSSAGSIVLEPPSSGVWSDSETSGLPPMGTIIINDERIRYYIVTNNTLTVAQRGADNTTPDSHTAGEEVFFPTTIARLAKRITEDLIGDGDTLTGIGEPYGQVIEDLIRTFRSQQFELTLDEQIRILVSQYFNTIEGHISKVAPTLLTEEPSFGPITPANLRDFLRYRNDPTTGSWRSNLSPWQSALAYWLHTGGTALHEKTVFPPETILATGTVSGAGAVTITPNPNFPRGINRYSSDDPDNYTQGYVPSLVQLRVTVAGDGEAIVNLYGSGLDTDGFYFGRPASQIISCLSVIPTDLFSINGKIFTATTGTVNSGIDGEFAAGGTNSQTVDNLADAINNSTDPLVAGIFEAESNSDTLVNLTLVSETDTNAYLLNSPRTTIQFIYGGIVLHPAGTIGGGAGSSAVIAGTGGDQDQDASIGRDDVRLFSANLDLSAAGNKILIDITGELMDIIYTDCSSDSVTIGSTFVIETLPFRTIT